MTLQRPSQRIQQLRMWSKVTQGSPGSFFASSSSDYIVICPMQFAEVILSPKICNVRFNLFVTIKNWNNSDLTFLLKANITDFYLFKFHCNFLCNENTCGRPNQDPSPTMWKLKKVITGRCCFPRVKFVKVSHWSNISPCILILERKTI